MSSSDEQRQALSAFMDSEADELESRRVSAALLADADLQASWRRFHVIGALLRDEVVLSRDEVTQSEPVLAAGSRAATLRLREALALEAPLSAEAAPANEVAPVHGSSQAPATQQRSNGRRWYAAGLGLATAAGLTAGMWLGAPGASFPGGSTGQLADTAAAGTAAPAQVAFVGRTSESEQLPTRQAEAEQAQDQQSQAQRRARLYMLMHAQQAGLSQASQGISLVKFVSYRQSSTDASNDSALHTTEQ